MTRRTTTFGPILASLLLCMMATLVRAQDPFDPDAPKPMPVKPAAMNPDDKPAPPSGPAPTEDVVILAIRESKPTTPIELITAIKALMNYGAHSEAQIYLQQFLDAKPTPNQLAELQRRFGTALFLRMVNDKRLDPLGAQVGERVMAGARQVFQDPARIKSLAAEAVTDNAIKREEALIELRNAGVEAVPPLVDLLGDAKKPQEQAHARDALVILGDTVVEPLLGLLDASDPELRVQAIAVLSRLKATRLVPLLLRPAYDPDEDPRVQAIAKSSLKRFLGEVPTRTDVEKFLLDKTKLYFAGESPLKPDEDNLVTMWRWDNEQKRSVPRYFPANKSVMLLPEVRGIEGIDKRIEQVPASSLMAAQMARDLYILFPTTPTYRRYYLATHLEAGKLTFGLDQPLPGGAGSLRETLGKMDATSLEDVLQWSIKNDHLAAAVGAAEILGDRGDPGLVTASGGAPRALAVALRHPDRRLRFAAAEAILKLNPPRDFPGASYVLETLGYFASSMGTRRVLVADPRIEDARVFGGLLSRAGYEVDVAATGDEALSLLLARPDYEIVFLGDAIEHQEMLRTWQQLRKDPRTANLLVGMLYRPENMLKIVEKAESDPLAGAMPYIHSRDTLDFQLGQLLRKVGTKFVGYDERQRQAVAAVDHFARLATDPRTPSYYELLRHEAALLSALSTSSLRAHAAPALGGLATPDAQRALVNVVSDENYDLADRQAAAKAFTAAVAKRGVLLTAREIGAQYDRYNASESQSKDTQQVLAAVLDAIEKKK